MKIPRWLLFTLVFVACASAGYVLVRSARVEGPGGRKGATSPSAAEPESHPAPAFGSGGRSAVDLRPDDAATEAGAIPGQRFLIFPDQAALERFLAQAKGKGIAILGRLDSVHALRVGFLRAVDLEALLAGNEKTGFLFPVLVPDLPQGGVQPGAVGLGSNLISWLGVEGYDRSTWGSGVTIAVLDTGVSGLAGLANVRQINLVDPPSELSELNAHGTAVASLVLQVAPGADVLSIRVADDFGASNSWLLAQGILQAADLGARVINISMGSYGESAIVDNAIDYARSLGAVVVAAAGNEGIGQLSYPAAYDGVVSTGGVDASGDHLLFSNSGSSLSMVAPGYDINTTGTEGETLSFSGTSASSPIVAGALAATMSNPVTPNLSANDALAALESNLNESGPPGADPLHGGGTINLGRVMRRNTKDIVDAAVASHWVEENGNASSLRVTVQNQGTAPIYNADLKVTTHAGTTPISVGSLTAGQIRTYTVPIASDNGVPMTFRSTLTLSNGQSDVNPANNRRSDVYTPSQAP
jgi:hypothetical protein